jgi:CheY-like chemotaxis protein/signal transduction histidine kinase
MQHPLLRWRALRVRQRLALVMGVVSGAVLLLICAPLYVLINHVSFSSMRDRLQVDAALIASRVSGDEHAVLHSADQPELQALNARLRTLRATMPGVRDIYTMRPHHGHIWEIVADAEEPGSPVYAAPETPYDVSHDLQVVAALDHPTSSEQPYEDEYGTWISGYAPIVDATGQTVAVVGVDMSVDAWRATQRRVQAPMLLAFFSGTLLSTVTAAWWARKLGDPIDAEKADLRATLGEAKRDRDQALAFAKARLDVLSTMSHELRTPMTAIIGVTSLARACPSSPALDNELGVMLDSAGQLMNVLNDVLDIAKIEARGVELAPYDFSPAELARSAAASAQQAIAHRTRPVTIEVAPEVPARVFVDGGRLGQALTCLITRANRGPGAVCVRLSAGSGWLEVTVDDHPSAARHHDDRAFEPFHEAGRIDGTSIGLVIAHRIATAMGGTLGVSTRASTHTAIRVPVEPARDPQPPPPPAIDTAPRSGRVLLADDHPTNRLVVGAQLRALGWSVDQAADGQEALDRCDGTTYDVILMDCQMPGVDGYEATRALRSLGDHHTRVIAITAEPDHDARPSCLDAGMDDVLTKPFSQEQLADTLRRWLPDPPTT